MDTVIHVAVAGATGRMGREVIKMVLADPELRLAAAIARTNQGADIGELTGSGRCGVEVMTDLEQALTASGADVLVDFTTPQSVMANSRVAIRHRVRPVIGTTGLSPSDIEELDKLCKEYGI